MTAPAIENAQGKLVINNAAATTMSYVLEGSSSIYHHRLSVIIFADSPVAPGAGLSLGPVCSLQQASAASGWPLSAQLLAAATQPPTHPNIPPLGQHLSCHTGFLVPKARPAGPDSLRCSWSVTEGCFSVLQPAAGLLAGGINFCFSGLLSTQVVFSSCFVKLGAAGIELQGRGVLCRI